MSKEMRVNSQAAHSASTTLMLLFLLVFCGSLLPSHLAWSRDSRGNRQTPVSRIYDDLHERERRLAELTQISIPRSPKYVVDATCFEPNFWRVRYPPIDRTSAPLDRDFTFYKAI
jgi:hypothetical protein